MQIVPAQPFTWDGAQYGPGDPLPPSIQTWRLLQHQIEAGRLNLLGAAADLQLVSAGGVDVDGLTLADGEYHPGLADIAPNTLAGMLRRGRLRCTNVPDMLAAAVCAAAARGRIQLRVVPPAAPAPEEPPPPPKKKPRHVQE